MLEFFNHFCYSLFFRVESPRTSTTRSFVTVLHRLFFFSLEHILFRSMPANGLNEWKKTIFESYLSTTSLMWTILQIEGLLQLLRQNNETLSSLEFIYCNLSSGSLNAICDSLRMKDTQTYRIQNFSISNTILERNPVSLPDGLVSFLSSCR